MTRVIVPRTADTDANRKAMPDSDFNSWVRPGQIADIIYYHASDEASALRESVIKVYNNS